MSMISPGTAWETMITRSSLRATAFPPLAMSTTSASVISGRFLFLFLLMMLQR